MPAAEAGAALAAPAYEVLVFDWDGTLVDSTGLIANAILRAAADLGVTVPDPSRAWHVIGLGLAQALALVLPELPRERIPEYVARYQVHFHQGEQDIHLFEGVRELLDTLRARGRRMAIATGKSRSGLARSLERAGLQGHFAAHRCADQTHPKPHPAMLLEIAEELDVDVGRLLMIGDTSHDLLMAESAGAGGVGVSFGAHPRAELEQRRAVAIFDQPAELHAWLLARY
jgi:phosphoglycolate phosphatase